MFVSIHAPTYRTATFRPGQYRRIVLESTGKHSALFRCPKCDQLLNLSNHIIDADTGTVFPNVKCPGYSVARGGTKSKCDFDDAVRLKGWRDGVISAFRK